MIVKYCQTDNGLQPALADGQQLLVGLDTQVTQRPARLAHIKRQGQEVLAGDRILSGQHRT